jgi:ABC-type amino acid transport substrate-binding protein
MLEKKRIDAVFLSEGVFYDVAESQGYTKNDFISYLQIERPFGMYISKVYLAQHPETLNKINRSIKKYTQGNLN